MNPIRREVLNGLFVIVLSTLLSAAIAAFQVKFNLQVWTLLVMAAAIAVSGYVIFEMTMGYLASTESRETEWLKRVGTPPRLEVDREGQSFIASNVEALNAMSPGSDYTVMFYSYAGGVGVTLLGDEGRAIRAAL